MAKFTQAISNTAEKGVALSDNVSLKANIRNQLSLANEGDSVIYDNVINDQEQPATPDGSRFYNTQLTEAMPYTKGIVMEPEKVTESEALELESRQKDLEADQSLQQLHGTSLGDYSPDDITKIAGPIAAPFIINSIKRLQETDSLFIPLDEARKMKSVKGMLGLRSEPEPETGVSDPSTIYEPADDKIWVDKDKTIPLTSAELFGHMNGVRFSFDSRVMEVLPDLQVLSLTLMESILSKQTEQESMISQEMIDNFARDEIKDIVGLTSEETSSGVSEAQIGRTLSEEWLKFQQVQELGMDTVPDAHLDPQNEMTKEAYEKLGLWAKQLYSLGNPIMYQAVQVKTGNGRTRGDYLVTPLGRMILGKNKRQLMPPKVRSRPQVSDKPQVTNQYSNIKEKTGNHYEDPKQSAQDKRKPKSPEAQIRVNTSKVRHVITPMRFKSGMLLSLMGLAAAADRKIVNGMLVVVGNAAEVLGIGQKTADSISNMSRDALYRVDSMLVELSTFKNLNHPKVAQLNRKIEILRAFAAESSTDEFKIRMYDFRSGQVLTMLQDIAEFKDDPISFANYIQTGTSRLGYSPQSMNMQTHKLARQLYGSGNSYQIKPGSNSNAEFAMLVTWGSHFFEEANVVPEQMMANMRKRIAMKDDKLMSIASVGRKLKEILNNYDSDATSNAILAMQQVENQIQGVGNVLKTKAEFNADSEVVRFMDEIFEHPNEAINLVEEAIELSRYMDTVERGGSFASSMRPVEVDGITNGLAGMGAQLGIGEMMYRIGVLRENPTKVLAEYEGIEGNLREVLSNNMRKTLPDVLNDMQFRDKFVGLDIEYLPELENILELAFNNTDDFLKYPLMTLPYGQAIKSMISMMMDVVTKDPSLTEIASRRKGGVPELSQILHFILEKNLIDTLNPEMISFTHRVKQLTELGMLVDEPIRYKKATGIYTSINTVDYVPRKGAPVISEIKEKYVKPKGDYVYGDPSKDHPSVLGSTRLTRNKYQPTSSEQNSLGLTPDGGWKVEQSILPQVIIGLDGATLAVSLSDSNYRQLQHASGVDTPYVTTIYDAVIGDLGSFKPLTELVNRSWKKVTFEYDLIKELADGANEALSRGGEKLKAEALNNPDGLRENDAHSAYLLDKGYDMIRYRPKNAKGKQGPLTAGMEHIRSIQQDTTARFDVLSDKERKLFSSRASMLTNQQAYDLFRITSQGLGNVLQSMYTSAATAKKGRSAILKALGPNPVFQYHVDAIKRFNFN